MKNWIFYKFNKIDQTFIYKRIGPAWENVDLPDKFKRNEWNIRGT